MFYTGRVIDGHFYLGTYWGYQEVSEKVYYEYMRLQWREWKVREREYRCYDEGGHRRCTGKCSECEQSTEGRPVSIEQLYEDSEFDIADTKRRSVEDTVIMKLLIEALYEAIDELPEEDQFLIRALYLFEKPMNQTEVAAQLHISQQAVSKRLKRTLETLHEALKDWED